MSRRTLIVAMVVGIGALVCLVAVSVVQLVGSNPTAAPATSSRETSPEPTSPTAAAPPPGTVRIGYSSLTPLHCAIGEVFRNTDVLARHGLTGELSYFPHGKDQHEACSAGEIDATFTCEVPAMVHLDRLPGLSLTSSVGELGDIALVVAADSDVTSPADLRGRSIAVLGGSASELVLDQWLASAKLVRGADVRTDRHGGIGETAIEAVTTGSADAAVLWDPWLSKAQQDHGLRVIESSPFWSMTALYDGRIEDEAVYHAALADAVRHVAAHTDEVAGWVADRSDIPVDVVVTVLKKNRFVGAGAEVDLRVPEDTLRRLDQCEAHALTTSRVGPSFQLDERMRLIQ